jgi:alpha-1,6-mannosyltransferase
LKEEGVANGSRFYLAQLVRNVLNIQAFSATSCVVAAALVLAIVTCFALVRSSEAPRGWLVGAAAIAAAALIVFSPHYPWYFTWVLPVLCALPYTPMIYLVTASPLLYLTLMDTSAGTLLRINTQLYLSFAMFVILDLMVRRWRGKRFGVIPWRRRSEKRDEYAVRG